MIESDNGWVTIAAMLGTSAAVLRQAAVPWTEDPATPPLTPEAFLSRLDELNAIARQLNDTNSTEQQILLALEPTDIPISLLKPAALRLVSD